jgi:hypothetical protein
LLNGPRIFGGLDADDRRRGGGGGVRSGRSGLRGRRRQAAYRGWLPPGRARAVGDGAGSLLHVFLVVFFPLPSVGTQYKLGDGFF